MFHGNFFEIKKYSHAVSEKLVKRAGRIQYMNGEINEVLKENIITIDKCI